MANHRFDIHELEGENGLPYFKGVCLCRATSDFMKHRWEAEDWGRAHLAMVERIKAHLAPKTISLKRQRDYFREQADSAANPAGDRRLWAALADELDHRLNDQGPVDEGQEPLFLLETETERKQP